MKEPLLNLTIRSVGISLVAATLAFATALAISLALLRVGKRTASMVSGVLEALVGMPTTVVGLLLYMMFSPSGPLGPLRLLYTPTAIILGEAVVALPVAFISMFRYLQGVREYVRELAEALGIPRDSELKLIVRESIPVLLSSYLVAFSRAIGELGVALIVGGGIEGYTSVLTTAITLHTSIGNYEYAIQIGAVLVAITVAVIAPLKVVGERVYGGTS